MGNFLHFMFQKLMISRWQICIEPDLAKMSSCPKPTVISSAKEKEAPGPCALSKGDNISDRHIIISPRRLEIQIKECILCAQGRK